jgi:hypothetical protein
MQQAKQPVMSPEGDETEKDRIYIIITAAEHIAYREHFVECPVFEVYVIGYQRACPAPGMFDS